MLFNLSLFSADRGIPNFGIIIRALTGKQLA